MDDSASADRYVSFCGIDCNKQANTLMEKLKQQIKELDPGNPWCRYFEQKFTQQAKIKHDNLFFVGSQLNNLYDFFEEIEDQEALNMLWKLEMECC